MEKNQSTVNGRAPLLLALFVSGMKFGDNAGWF
jgi:hypothetical protein